MQNLFGVLDEVEQVTDEMYKNAEMLLDLYRKVKFRVYRNLEEIDEELYIEDRKNLTLLLNNILDFDSTIEKRRIQERLASNNFNLCLLEIMEDALLIVKRYPDDGELFYRLLRYRYFDSFKNTNEDVMMMLEDMPYTTYYRKRKKPFVCMQRCFGSSQKGTGTIMCLLPFIGNHHAQCLSDFAFVGLFGEHLHHDQ